MSVKIRKLVTVNGVVQRAPLAFQLREGWGVDRNDAEILGDDAGQALELLGEDPAGLAVDLPVDKPVLLHLAQVLHERRDGEVDVLEDLLVGQERDRDVREDHRRGRRSR